MSHNLRRLILFTMACLMVLSALACSPAKSKNNQVLMIITEESDDVDLMLTREVGVMVDMLGKAGYQVVTATASGREVVGITKTLKPDKKLSDVKVEEYAGVIIPCMARSDGSPIPVGASKVINQAVAQNKVIAAQMGGVIMLYEAGVLKGKQFAILEEIKDRYRDGIYMGEGVVQDGKIITSGICPYLEKQMGKKDGTVDLTQKFIDALQSS
jgi:putative intracellular protease/amidase